MKENIYQHVVNTIGFKRDIEMSQLQQIKHILLTQKMAGFDN